MALALAAAALAVAWLIFRLERFASRTREIEAAHASLLAVQGAILGQTGPAAVEPPPSEPAWGPIYFSTIYDAEALNQRAHLARRQTEIGVFDQVFVVPTEPFEQLATSSGESSARESPNETSADYAGTSRCRVS